MKLKLLEFSFPATYANDICKFSDTVSFSAIYLLIVKAVCDNTDIVRRRRPAAGKKSQNSLYGLQYFIMQAGNSFYLSLSSNHSFTTSDG